MHHFTHMLRVPSGMVLLVHFRKVLPAQPHAMVTTVRCGQRSHSMLSAPERAGAALYHLEKPSTSAPWEAVAAAAAGAPVEEAAVGGRLTVPLSPPRGPGGIG